MALSCALVLLMVLVGSSMLAACTAFPSSGAGGHGQWPPFNRTSMPSFGARGRWSSFNHSGNSPRKIVVGGADKWRFGLNNSDWASKNGPFFQDDILVFKYELPTKAAPHGHSVYLLPDRNSYLNCDLKKAKLLANTSQGIGKGFEYRLSSHGRSRTTSSAASPTASTAGPA